jgi:hypothetical protein
MNDNDQTGNLKIYFYVATPNRPDMPRRYPSAILAPHAVHRLRIDQGGRRACCPSLQANERRNQRDARLLAGLPDRD